MREQILQCDCGIDIAITAPSLMKYRIYCRRCQKDITLSDDSENTLIIDEQHEKQEAAHQLNPPIQEGIPEKVDYYRFEKRLAAGSFGSVFLGTDERDNSKVAIKVLKSDITQKAEDRDKLVDYFIRETQILMAIDHPGIVKVKGCGNLAGKPYMAMEYIEGPTLAKVIGKKPLAGYKALLIGYRICSALKYGHDHFQLVHRDIKPENIILAAREQYIPKLVDFGLAKNLGDTYASLTASGMILGTPFYMTREQIIDGKAVDHRTDIYGLGANIYFMLTGTPPYYNYYKGGIPRVLKAILNDELLPVRDLLPNIPVDIEELVHKAMASNPQDRYSSFDEFKTALKKSISLCKNKPI